MGKRTKEQRQRKSVEMLLYTEAEEQEFNSSSNVPYPVLNLANDRQQVTPNRPNMDARAHEFAAEATGTKNQINTNLLRLSIDEASTGRAGSGRSAGRTPGRDRNQNRSTSARNRLHPGPRFDGSNNSRPSSSRSRKSRNSGWDMDQSSSNQLGIHYRAFIKERFSMYTECVLPVKSPKDGSKCLCGRELRILEHRITQNNTETTWTPAKSMRKSPTSSYGLVVFRDKRPQLPGMSNWFKDDIPLGRPYIRVSKDEVIDNPRNLRELLVDKWDLDPPRVLLAVTGGATSFNLPPRLDQMVKEGLEKAAASKSMWITSGGTNTGVMKYVGQALADAKSYVPVIGFVPWSICRGRDILSTYGDGQPTDGGLVYYGDPDKMNPPFMALDRNHTHFVIVDDGTEGKFGGEIEARTAIEKAVCELESHGEFGSESPISTVLLAIQGGPGTVKTIYENLQSNVPVVIVDGSGKACNAIAFAMQMPRPGADGEIRVDELSPFTSEALDELIMNEFQVKKGSPTFENVRGLCMKCVETEKFCSLLHIYSVDYSGEANESLDVAIMQAVLSHDSDQWDKWSERQAKHGVVDSVTADADDGGIGGMIRRRDLTRVLRLEMALMWNHISVVKTEVSRYCVLPGLSKMMTSLAYMMKAEGAMTYQTEPKIDQNRHIMTSDAMGITIAKGEALELIRMRGSGTMWLMRHPKKDVEFWVRCDHVTRDVSKSSFADSVILSHVKMLKYLLIEEKSQFVELFLQGMRTMDSHAFLSLKTSQIWERAANYKQLVNVKKRQNVANLAAERTYNVGRADRAGRTGTTPSPMPSPRIDGSPSSADHVSQTAANQKGKGATLGQNDPKGRNDDRSVEKNRMSMMLDQIDVFDDSDVALPRFIDAKIIKLVADARLVCWIEKKKMQRQDCGFQLTEETEEVLEYLATFSHPDMLTGTPGEAADREEWAVWFLKYLFFKGYKVAHATMGREQGLSQVDHCDDLLDSIADTIHNRWLSKKYEAGWVYSTKYSRSSRRSPYLRLYDQLDHEDRVFNEKYAENLLEAVLASGLWLWRPDIMESLYFHATFDPNRGMVHLRNRFNGGAMWRTQIHAMIADVVGPGYAKDFTTFNALDPYFHLMVWSVLTMRFKLAHFFWRQRPQYSMQYAYFAAMICTNVQTDKAISPEARDKFQRQNQKFRDYCNGILEECTRSDEAKTKRLLMSQYESVGWMTLADMAYYLKDTEVTSKEIYIKVMQADWYGNVDPSNNFLKYCLGIVLPVPFLVPHSSDRSSDQRNVSTLSGSFPSTQSSDVGPVHGGANRPNNSTRRGYFDRVWAPFIKHLSIKINMDSLFTASAPRIVFTGKQWDDLDNNGIVGTIHFECDTSDAEIYYTLDGSDPDAEFNTTRYQARNSRDTSCQVILRQKKIHVIKAFARHPRWNDPRYRFVNSGITIKRIDAGVCDPELNGLPSFIFGPKKTSWGEGSYGFFSTVLWRIKTFYESPFTIFLFFLLNSLGYVMCYSYTAIITTTTLSEIMQMNTSESVMTLIVYAWTVTLISDEIRQVMSSGYRKWWANPWNRINVGSYINTAISAALRYNQNRDQLLLSRTLYALGAMILWLRTARMYGIDRNLGPKLTMIKTMMNDVFIFIMLLLVVLIGYGVAMHAILEPRRSFDDQSLMTVFYKPTFHAIGETFLEQYQSKTNCLGEEFTQCSSVSQYLVLGMMIIYLIISNILLVNLLIAMMAQSYQTIASQAKKIWSLQNINLLVEFRELVPLPPPINLLHNVFELLIYLLWSAWQSNGVGTNAVNPLIGMRIEKCEVSPYALTTTNDIKFVREATGRWIKEMENENKHDTTRKLIMDMIDKRMGGVESKLKDIEFSLEKISTRGQKDEKRLWTMLAKKVKLGGTLAGKAGKGSSKARQQKAASDMSEISDLSD